MGHCRDWGDFAEQLAFINVGMNWKKGTEEGAEVAERGQVGSCPGSEVFPPEGRVKCPKAKRGRLLEEGKYRPGVCLHKDTVPLQREAVGLNGKEGIRHVGGEKRRTPAV